MAALQVTLLPPRRWSQFKREPLCRALFLDIYTTPMDTFQGDHMRHIITWARSSPNTGSTVSLSTQSVSTSIWSKTTGDDDMLTMSNLDEMIRFYHHLTCSVVFCRLRTMSLSPASFLSILPAPWVTKHFEQDKVKVPIRIDFYVGGDDEQHGWWHVNMTAKCVVHQILDNWYQWYHEAPKQADIGSIDVEWYNNKGEYCTPWDLQGYDLFRVNYQDDGMRWTGDVSQPTIDGYQMSVSCFSHNTVQLEWTGYRRSTIFAFGG